MNKQDKIEIAIGVSLIVIGAAIAGYASYRYDKLASAQNETYRERRMQQGWELIQSSHAFVTASPEMRIQMFDAYWKTNGGKK